MCADLLNGQAPLDEKTVDYIRRARVQVKLCIKSLKSVRAMCEERATCKERAMLDGEAVACMDSARAQIQACVENLKSDVPETIDVGSLNAYLDDMQATNEILCDGLILGGECATRVRVRTEADDKGAEEPLLLEKIGTHTHSQLQQKMSKFEIPAVAVRADMINGRFELDEKTVTYMDRARVQIQACVESLKSDAPSTIDVGRLIAFIDAMQAAKNILCDAVILGSELDTRKRARTEAGDKEADE